MQRFRALEPLPPCFALGGRSNPDYYGWMANRLAAIFPDFTIETFPERPTWTRLIGSSPTASPARCWRSGSEPAQWARTSNGRPVPRGLSYRKAQDCRLRGGTWEPTNRCRSQP